jgi:hypothetical protein
LHRSIGDNRALAVEDNTSDSAMKSLSKSGRANDECEKDKKGFPGAVHRRLLMKLLEGLFKAQRFVNPKNSEVA